MDPRVAGIANDRTSGAAAIARRAAEILGSATAAEMPDLAVRLARAQPAMASLWRLCNGAVLARSPREYCREFQARIEAEVAEVAGRAAAIIPAGAVVMTHSSSETVRRALLEVRPRRVIATESSPLCEGRALAEELAAKGVEVSVVADAAMVRAAGRADIVVCGADSVSPQGVVNKVGTYLLALAAREAGEPAYVLAGTSKLVPDESLITLDDSLDGLFESTPLDRFTAIVTEAGPMTAEGIRASARGIEIHPAFRK